MPDQTKTIQFTRHSFWLSLVLPFFLNSAEFNQTSIERLAGGPTLSASESGEFSVITYNIAGLPQMLSSAATDRAVSTAEIGRKLNIFDIAHVQEDFNYNRFLYKVSTHQFKTVTKGKVLFGDGLNTLSKFPVRELRRIKWKDCTGADCLTPKGFSYSRIEIAGGTFIDFYNVHANAYNHLAAAAARRKNIMQLSEFIQKNSAGNAVVIMGDLNGHYSYKHDNIGFLLSQHGLQDPWIFVNNTGRIPNSSFDMPASDILSLNESSETIDKILYRGSSSIELQVSDYRLEKDLFTNARGLPLSDHHPVSARISWTVNKSEKHRLITVSR